MSGRELDTFKEVVSCPSAILEQNSGRLHAGAREPASDSDLHCLLVSCLTMDELLYLSVLICEKVM